MIIDLTNLGKLAREIDESFDGAEIDLTDEAVSLAGRPELKGQISRDGKKAELSAVVRVDVSLDCTRCLDPIRRTLEIVFNSVFVDSPDDEELGEAEISSERLDESIADNGRIDLAEVVREQILLALPEQVFCNGDCKGLCPKCGSNLNLIDCKCADDDIDPRWAALRNLK